MNGQIAEKDALPTGLRPTNLTKRPTLKNGKKKNNQKRGVPPIMRAPMRED